MTAPAGIPSPLEFFDKLKWIDGRQLTTVIEGYREKIFTEALYSFDPDGRPTFNLVLTGRAKKNWKTTDLCLAALYKFLCWQSPQGNDGYIVASDEGQAGDDLQLIKRLITANSLLDRELVVRAKAVERRDGAGTLSILPGRDVAGEHGKTFSFCGFDELHTQRNWDLLEALTLDPSRPEAIWWVTSYASVFNSAGSPLYDLFQAGKRGDDKGLFFSWYSGDFCTDPDLANAEPEVRANPSMASWGNPDYLGQQRRRLPSHKYRRLHLNLPGLPAGSAFDIAAVMDAIKVGRKRLKFDPTLDYIAFVDMSGGSADDAVLAVAHRDEKTERVVLDAVISQSGRPPFNPRRAVSKFSGILKSYGLSHVTGDAFGGETFRQDFSEHGIGYTVSALPKSALYEQLEPLLNAGEVELLDVSRLQEQLLGLVWRGKKIDHMVSEHDDFANVVAGVMSLVQAVVTESLEGAAFAGHSAAADFGPFNDPPAPEPFDFQIPF